jgi:hypothetical protein
LLVLAAHDAILWSRACHTFPSPRLVALGASSDHGGGCLVPGDVLRRRAPVLVSPRAGVGGIDRIQANPVPATGFAPRHSRNLTAVTHSSIPHRYDKFGSSNIALQNRQLLSTR